VLAQTAGDFAGTTGLVQSVSGVDFTSGRNIGNVDRLSQGLASTGQLLLTGIGIGGAVKTLEKGISAGAVRGNFDVTSTFRDGRFRDITLQPGTQLERAFQEGVNDPIGSFMTRGSTAHRITSTNSAVNELGLRGTSNVNPNRLTTIEVTQSTPAQIGFIDSAGSRSTQIVVNRNNLSNLRRVPGTTRTLE
jgi:hypothetical protein